MQEVTCPQCENIVQITPDAPICSVCDADLRAFVDPATAATYFYQRASEMATDGRRQQALTEVNRGLTYFDTSDLRLLGAILSNQVGDYSQMRNHVAAIPVDDALRSEGEWLLRSHQAKQRGRRTSSKSGASTALPAALQADGGEATVSRGGQRTSWPLILAFGILILLAILWFLGLPGAREGDDAAATTGATPTITGPVEEQLSAEAQPSDEGSAVEGGVEENVEDDPMSDAEAAEPAAVLPTPTLPPTDTPEPTAAPTPTEEAGASGPVDVSGYLNERGYLGLDQLVDVDGELDDGVLLLTGEVSMMEDLDLLVDVVSALEGAEEVDASEVVLSPPLTYTIQVGDSLWTISTRVYGDTEHMDDIYRLNREAIGSPEFLPVGVEIELPRPSEEEDLGVIE